MSKVFSDHLFRQATSPPSHFRSFPAFLAVAALDKAFYRGDLAIRHARIIRTPLTKRASDHLPLVVDFHLTGNGRPVYQRVGETRLLTLRTAKRGCHGFGPPWMCRGVPRNQNRRPEPVLAHSG